MATRMCHGSPCSGQRNAPFWASKAKELCQGVAANWTIATNCKLTFRMDYTRLYLIYISLLWLNSGILVKSPLEGNCPYSNLVQFHFAGFSSHKILIWLKYFSLVNSGQYLQVWLHQRASPFHSLVLYKALSWWNFIDCIDSLLWNISLGSSYNINSCLSTTDSFYRY